MVKRNGNEYLDVEEVAKRFEVNPKTVYRLAQQGKIPAVKFGRQWRFNAASLETWSKNKENEL